MLILSVSVVFMEKDILIIIKVDMVRDFPFLDSDLINKPLLLLALFDESRLENPTSVHDVLFNFSQYPIDSFSVIFSGIFLFNLGYLLSPVVLLKSHVKLVCLERFHSVVVLGICVSFRLDVLDEIFIAELLSCLHCVVEGFRVVRFDSVIDLGGHKLVELYC